MGWHRARAMPKLLHRYLGNPVLSFIGRLFFQNKVETSIVGYGILQGKEASGMELASEMVVKAGLAGLRVDEFPTRLVTTPR